MRKKTPKIPVPSKVVKQPNTEDTSSSEEDESEIIENEEEDIEETTELKEEEKTEPKPAIDEEPKPSILKADAKVIGQQFHQFFFPNSLDQTNLVILL